MSDNPFLLPPRAAPPAAPAPAVPLPEAPDAAPASTDYIAVPASVESATHRIGRPAPVPTPAAADEIVSEETRVAPTGLAASTIWTLALDDGTRVPLTGPVLLGRDPAGIPESPTAQLLAVSDPGKTVSKTHALLEPASGGVRVRELHSTNGVVIDTAARREVLAAGGEGLAVAGSTILLGSFAISVAAD